MNFNWSTTFFSHTTVSFNIFIILLDYPPNIFDFAIIKTSIAFAFITRNKLILFFCKLRDIDFIKHMSVVLVFYLLLLLLPSRSKLLRADIEDIQFWFRICRRHHRRHWRKFCRVWFKLDRICLTFKREFRCVGI